MDPHFALLIERLKQAVAAYEADVLRFGPAAEFGTLERAFAGVQRVVSHFTERDRPANEG